MIIFFKITTLHAVLFNAVTLREFINIYEVLRDVCEKKSKKLYLRFS